MFMDWKNQYSENECTTQSNLWIQCNPHQATNGIFHKATTNNFTTCMEIQKPQIPKEILLCFPLGVLQFLVLHLDL